MKTLVVDDDVHTCEDGSEAVTAHRQALDSGQPYDLICMDITMPRMNGLEALRLIRTEEEARGLSRPQAAKVIITTVTGDADTITQAFRESSDAYVRKPIETGDLIDLVHCLLRGGQ